MDKHHSLNDLAASFPVQLFKIHTNKDGGGRIQLDFGADALEEIQKVQMANGRGGMNFMLALVPLKNEIIGPDVDPETGEINL